MRTPIAPMADAARVRSTYDFGANVERRLVAGRRRCEVRRLGGCGVDLFGAVCELDIEGIVAKRADGIYDPTMTVWIKVKNEYLGRPPLRVDERQLG